MSQSISRTRSEHRPTVRPGIVHLVLTLLLAVAALLPVAAHGQDSSAGEQIEGEYGLRVAHEDDDQAGDPGAELVVGWLTEEVRPGVLEVVTDAEVILRRETAASRAHEVRFPRPDADEILIRYGAGPTSGGGSDAPEPSLQETRLRLASEGTPPPDVLTGVDSLFVIGDVHGEYDSLLGTLEGAGLVDADGRWSGGTRHVVFLGDVFDRGPDVTKSLWFLYRLEEEASAAGGGAHVVLGNHEVMIFTEDLRYVSPKERLVARLHGVPYYDLFDVRRSVLGRWLARRPAAMRVDDVLLAHGGITPRFADYGVEALNDSIGAFLREDLFYGWSDTTVVVVADSSVVERAEEIYRRVLVMDSAAVARRNEVFFGDEGPLWYRGYVLRDDLGRELEQVLDAHGARIHVVGHTALPSIRPRYGGRLVAVDLEDPATEGLLLVRSPDTEGYRGWRYGPDGPIGEIELTARE